MKIVFSTLVYVIILVFAAFASELDLITVGAGPMGMGKSGSTFSKDINTLFLNPAGLGDARRLQLTSMYTKLLNEVQYVVGGGIYPLPLGTIGFSCTAAQVADVPITTVSTDGSLNQDNIQFVGTTNSILSLSYGINIGGGLRSGSTLKFINDDLSAGKASGYDLDLGFRYSPFDGIELALVQKNILPASSGACLTWNTGLKEGIPTKTSVAGGIILNDGSLKMEVGAEKYTLLDRYPVQYHAGVEWWPVELFALRCGFDQDHVPAENAIRISTVTVPSAGVGLRFAGWQFDYAYRLAYNNFDNNAHYFSTSYIGQQDFTPPSLEYRFVDKQIYRESNLRVGLKLSEKVKKISAVLDDEMEIELEPNHKNMVLLENHLPAEMSLGEHKITVLADDFEGNRLVQDIQFTVSPRPPSIDFEMRKDRLITKAGELAIKGKARGEKIFLNEAEIILDKEGGFETIAKFEAGINKLRFKVIGEGGDEIEKMITVLKENNAVNEGEDKNDK